MKLACFSRHALLPLRHRFDSHFDPPSHGHEHERTVRRCVYSNKLFFPHTLLNSINSNISCCSHFEHFRYILQICNDTGVAKVNETYDTTMKPSRSESDLLMLCFATHPIIRTRHDDYSYSYGGQCPGRTNSVPASNVNGLQPTPEQPAPPRQVCMAEARTLSLVYMNVTVDLNSIKPFFYFPGGFDACERRRVQYRDDRSSAQAKRLGPLNNLPTAEQGNAECFKANMI